MGKNKDKKKKGLGMEKTLAKTEKKLQKNLKKELKEIGEEDIENLIANFTEKEKELNQVKEELLPLGKFPSRRGGASFNLNPEREEIILFGGDYYDGAKVYMYNHLYIYSIKKNQWTLIKAPNSPPPRTFHQSVFISRNAGELWVFGGEFSSPSQSQFYHYNDLWMFSFQTKQWTKVLSPNTPSPRSGHRMAVLKKYIILFGGYYDNLRNCRFYNDTHLFNLDTNQWEEVKFSAASDCPSPRSACQLSVCNKNNTIVLYGGFSKEKLKKDKEKGVVHSDMFVLSHELKKNEKIEWCWKKCKQTGLKPSERVSFSMIGLHDDTAILFGGVFDQDDVDMEEEDDDEMNSSFYNDLYKLDLNTFKWTQLNLRGKKEQKSKKSKKDENNSSQDQEMAEELEQDEYEENKQEQDIKIDDLNIEKEDKSSSDVFTLSYSQKEANQQNSETTDTVVTVKQSEQNIFTPHPRRSSYLQFFKGNLYLYGGKFEDKNDKEYTFNDLYCLNLKKLDEWKTLFEDKEINLEIKKQAENSDLDEDEEESDEEDEEEIEDDSDSEMEINAPKIELNETFEDYFERTNEIWTSEAQNEFPNEKSKKVINKMALELCKMFYGSFKPI